MWAAAINNRRRRAKGDNSVPGTPTRTPDLSKLGVPVHRTGIRSTSTLCRPEVCPPLHTSGQESQEENQETVWRAGPLKAAHKRSVWMRLSSLTAAPRAAPKKNQKRRETKQECPTHGNVRGLAQGDGPARAARCPSTETEVRGVGGAGVPPVTETAGRERFEAPCVSGCL
jgi:hypothetical protein